jgi:hypothetical protein
MSVRTTKTNGSRRQLLLVPSLLLAMLAAACGSASDDSSAVPRRESATEPGAQVVRVHYTRPVPRDPDDGYGVELDVIARGADQSRTEMALLVDDGSVDETVLIIRDGNRALIYDPEARTPSFTVMEAADEHPEDIPWESSPVEPDSKEFQEACPGADPAGTRTIVGRGAVGYTCTWDDPDPALDRTEEVWLDKATGMLLESGDLKATEFVVGPDIDRDTFSTRPPAGAQVDVVKATGKGPPRPEGEGEPSPMDALATIASTSPVPIYYLGPEFEGVPLTEVAVFDEDSGSEVPGDLRIDAGQSLTIWYGEQFQMETTPFVPSQHGRVDGCRRLPSLRGVPTAELKQAGYVWLLTADLVIMLGVDSSKRAESAAAALVEYGKERPGADLPAPAARNVAAVDRRCGAEPGAHG